MGMGDRERCPVCTGDIDEDSAVDCVDCGSTFCGEAHLRRHKSTDGGCFPFRVERDEERGRFFVATRDIKALDVVLEDWSFLSGPATKSKPVCLECLAILSRDNYVECKGCGFPMCGDSPDCLEGKNHSRECKQLAKLGGCPTLDWNGQNNPVYSSIFPLRALNLKADDPERWKEVDSLMSGDTSDLKDGFGGLGPEIVQYVRKMLDQDSDDDDTEEEVLRILGIRRTNANAMGCLDGNKQGNLLFPTYSLMNAHCYCNTFYSLAPDGDAHKLEVRAQVDIAKGQEITTRYVCSFDCLPGRQSKIWQNWKFLCKCKRCSDPTDLGTYFSALRCRDCRAGHLLPVSTGILNPPWRCDRCGATHGPRHVTQRLGECERAMRDGFFASRKDLEAFLAGEVHPNHFLMCTLLQKRLFVRDGFNSKSEESLEEMVAVGEKLLRIVTTIDPGFTQRRGRILKVLAKDKLLLAKLRRDGCRVGEEEFRESVRLARDQCKTMALCFMYA